MREAKVLVKRTNGLREAHSQQRQWERGRGFESEPTRQMTVEQQLLGTELRTACC